MRFAACWQSVLSISTFFWYLRTSLNQRFRRTCSFVSGAFYPFLMQQSLLQPTSQILCVEYEFVHSQIEVLARPSDELCTSCSNANLFARRIERHVQLPLVRIEYLSRQLSSSFLKKDRSFVSNSSRPSLVLYCGSSHHKHFRFCSSKALKPSRVSR